MFSITSAVVNEKRDRRFTFLYSLIRSRIPFPTSQDKSDLYQQISVAPGQQHADDKALRLYRYLHLNCKLNLNRHL